MVSEARRLVMSIAKVVGNERVRKGDVVRLRSGSPEMTIVEFTMSYSGPGEGKKAGCEWFEDDGPRFCPFPPVALMLVRRAPENEYFQEIDGELTLPEVDW
jgi:uncharacterized protein YodC (DUF2158 family)